LSAKGTIGSEEILGFSVMGGILVAIGIALFIAFFVGKNMLAKEIAAEENKLAENQQLPDQR
jgi:hypothetical protein